MFKKHVLPILGLVTLAFVGSWFVCAWSPPVDVQVYPRYYDGEMHYEPLPAPNLEDENWWVQAKDLVEQEYQDTIDPQIAPIEEEKPTWDCNDTAKLDSAQAWADEMDSLGRLRCDKITKAILKKHEGHEIQYSDSQNLVASAPGGCSMDCWDCSMCGHFDLYSYYPLRRTLVRCDDKVWRIAKAKQSYWE